MKKFNELERKRSAEPKDFLYDAVELIQDYEGNEYPADVAALTDLEKRFTYHPPRPDQPARYTYLRDLGGALGQAILENTPPSREQSLALTNLEQAIFWANAAIARNEG